MSASPTVRADVPLVSFHLPQHANKLSYLSLIIDRENPSLELFAYRGLGVDPLHSQTELGINLPLLFLLLLFSELYLHRSTCFTIAS